MYNTELQQQLKEYISELGSQNKAAQAIGKSTAAISTYLNGTYKGNVEKFESHLREVFKNKKAAESLKSSTVSGKYKPTSISESVYETIRLCHLKGGLAIDCGDAGIGKTMACKKYTEDSGCLFLRGEIYE